MVWTVFEAFFNAKITIFSMKQGAMFKKFLACGEHLQSRVL